MSLQHSFRFSSSFHFSFVSSLSPLPFPSLSFSSHLNRLTLKSPLLSTNAIFSCSSPVPHSKAHFKFPCFISHNISTGLPQEEKEHESDTPREFQDLAKDGPVYQKTLRLVECSMFAAITGLAYFLSNSLAIENYFGCFFPLPIVISSIRWGPAAGRKTMVATVMLLLTLSGPVKACTYLLMHGLVGLTMGSLWRLGADWRLSVLLCTFVRAMGAMGYVLISSFLIRENILSLITINIHASLTYVLAAVGVNAIPSMEAIYAIFGSLLLLNCGFFVFLLHIIYALLLTKLGMKASLMLPRWLEKAI